MSPYITGYFYFLLNSNKFICIEEILEINLKLEPYFFLLGIYPANSNIRKKHRIFLDIGLLLAKRVFAIA